MTGLLILALLALALAGGAVLLRGAGRRRPARGGAPWRPAHPPPPTAAAERRALELLRSVVNRDEWDMFQDLGFICVRGRRRSAGGPGRYRYLVYPHRPVVALLPGSLAPVREYCIRFPDGARGPAESLPVGDDVLAKWMTLRGDEERLLSFANVAAPGCEVPIDDIERDLERLARWRTAREDPFGAIRPV